MQRYVSNNILHTHIYIYIYIFIYIEVFISNNDIDKNHNIMLIIYITKIIFNYKIHR